MTREEFNKLATWEKVVCPDCGTKTEHPYPNCNCRSQTPCKEFPRGYHIFEYHHSCPH